MHIQTLSTVLSPITSLDDAIPSPTSGPSAGSIGVAAGGPRGVLWLGPPSWSHRLARRTRRARAGGGR